MRKTWVLRKKEENSLEGYVFQPRGRRFAASWQEDVAFSSLRGERVILLFEDPQAYFHRETLVKGPPEVLELQIREHLRNFGLVEEGLRVVFKIEEELPPHVLVSFLACHLSSVEDVLEGLLHKEVRLAGLHHQAVALGALGNLVSEEAILVAEAQPQGLWLVITEREKIHYIRFFEADEFLELSSSLVEESVLAALDFAQRALKKEVRKLLPLGPKRDVFPTVKHLEILEPPYDRFRGVSPEEIFERPAFFGGLFAPRDFDLTPPFHGIWLKNLRWARWVAGGLLIFSLFGFGGWFHFAKENRSLAREVSRIEQDLRKKATLLHQEFPPFHAEKFGKFWETYQRFSQEPRLDFFLVWLAKNLPQGAKVVDFQAQRAPEGLILNLLVSFKAPFQVAQEEFSRFSRRLSANNYLQKSRLTYSEQEGEGLFEFKFRPTK